jgi:hypothetical protein
MKRIIVKTSGTVTEMPGNVINAKRNVAATPGNAVKSPNHAGKMKKNTGNIPGRAGGKRGDVRTFPIQPAEMPAHPNLPLIKQ